MASLTTTTDTSQAFSGLQAKLANVQGLLFNQWAGYLDTLVHDAFKAESSPIGVPWQVLSPATLAIKAANGSQKNILRATGTLYATITGKVLPDGAQVGTNQTVAGYSLGAIHQFGATVPITAKMRSYFWAMYYQARGQSAATKAIKGRAGSKAQAGRDKDAANLSDAALMYRAMALTKRQSFTIVPRPFLPMDSGGKVDDFVIEELSQLALDYFAD
jgi:phage gpG-like protein